MSDEPVEGSDVPDPVREWLSGIASERGLTERELVGQLLSSDAAELLADADVDSTRLEERIQALEIGISELDAELDEKIRDVRERVIQVKREADAKAPLGHDHVELEAGVERFGEHLEAIGHDFVELDASVDRLDDRIEHVDERMGQGFSNFEEVLSYLIDTTDDVREKLETLAVATMEGRERVGQLAAANARRTAVDGLRESANEHGITEAKCENCGETVHLGLLTAPDCPHCHRQFTELEPRRGFFRSSVLHTGERPALEGEVAGDTPDLGSLVAEDEPSPPAFDGAPVGRDPSTSTADETGDRSLDDEIEEAAAGSAMEDPATDDVDVVSGVGPTYAERLREAGVSTVGDLALAEPGRLARRTDIEPGRVENLVRRARKLVESG